MADGDDDTVLFGERDDFAPFCGTCGYTINAPAPAPEPPWKRVEVASTKNSL